MISMVAHIVKYIYYTCIYVRYTMAEILVNKGELKNIRDTIDKILHTKEQNVIRHPQYASYESEELSERQKEILKYVGKKPGATKEDVIKNNPHIGSRMTIVKAINELIAMKLLIVKRGLNQHIQHLYTNNEHVVLSLFNDLELFKQVYFKLVDETTKVLKKLYQTDPQIILDVYHDLVRTLLMPYKHLIIVYITSDLLLWRHLRALDKETLHNKFAIVYGSMKEIHTKLHESIAPLNIIFFSDPRFGPPNTESELSASLYDVQDVSNLERIISFLSYYEQFELNTFAEAVLDVLWKISYPSASKMSYQKTNENLLGIGETLYPDTNLKRRKRKI